MDETQKWEYRVQTTGGALKQAKDEEMETMLNEWGEEGWEIITIHNLEGSNKVRVIARRPLSSSTRRSRSWPT